MIVIRVFGLPAAQGSKRHVGRGIMVESSKALKPWREAVKHAALDVRQHLFDIDHPHGTDDGFWWALDGPLIADMIFTFRRPKSHYRTGRNAHLLRDAAPTRPCSPPDLSKLARSTEDALTDAGIWVDDARLVQYGRLAKVWVSEDTDALDAPGAVIRVAEYGGAP